MNQVFMDFLNLLGIAVAGILFAAFFAPLEALGWWAGWYGEEMEPADGSANPRRQGFAPETAKATPVNVQYYVVFLDGINRGLETVPPLVRQLLVDLSAALPTACILGDVLPYSVTNRVLTAHRPLARFWRSILWLKRMFPKVPINLLINLHNSLQVAVSADKRYGPIYNQGEANLILQDLLRHGYNVAQRIPIILIGYSGGGQVAIGAAPFLVEVLDAPLSVVSLGGVMSADSGLEAVDRLTHLTGSRDKIEPIGRLIFPGRWPLLPHSAWNRAERQGRIVHIDMGPMTHNGRDSYLDASAYLADGNSHLAKTVDTLVRCIVHRTPKIVARKLAIPNR